MPLHMPENLFEYYLFENAAKAKEILADSSINYSDFEKAFPDVPEYLGKFAEWLMDNNDEEDLNGAYKDIKELKTLNIKIDRDINSFSSLGEFIGYMALLKRKKLREKPSEEIPKIVSETPKKINQNLDKVENKNEIPTEETIDEKIKIKPLKSGFQCAVDIYNSDALNIPGQGLYIWTNKEYLERKDNKIPLKFGQYGSQAKKTQKTPVTTIESYTHTTADDIVILYAIRLNDYFKSSQNTKKFISAYQIEQIIGKEIVKRGGFHEDQGKSTELFGGFPLKNLIALINETLFDAKK